MQEVIDASMVAACTKEGVKPKQVFFILVFFAVTSIVIGYPNKRLKTKFFVFEGNS